MKRARPGDPRPSRCRVRRHPGALCQSCHLTIQGKVIMARTWILPHSPWMRPLVAGYYAAMFGLPTEREWVEAHIDELVAVGQGRIAAEAVAP